MRELVAYGIPLTMLASLLAGIVVAMGVALVWPRLIVFAYVTILMLFPQSSSYGLADPTAASFVYVKGTKHFFFSFLDMVILGTWLMAVLYGRLWAKDRPPRTPLTAFYLAFAIAFAGHVVANAIEGTTPWIINFSGRGVINVLWQGMFVSLLLTVVRTEKDLRLLLFIMLSCIALRDGYGLARYLIMGGDPQNAYATVQNLGVRITFWDINDSLLATFGLAYAGWKLLAERDLDGYERLKWAAMGLLCALIPVLSARRTAQVGVLLALLLLALILPRGRRWVAVTAFAVMSAVALMAVSARTSGGGTLGDRLLFDTGSRYYDDPRRSRFHELQTAWETAKDSPIFGVGPSGSFRVRSHFGLEYHLGRYDYVHSGFGHVFLKMGAIGLAAFGGLFMSYFIFVARSWTRLPSKWKAPFVSALCVVIAQMPNMMFGTPIGEIRTMMVLGLMFALPFIVTRISQRGGADEVSAKATTLTSLKAVRV